MNPQQTTHERLNYLDSARGIAALMVLFGHVINWKYGEKTVIHAASIVINANDAVSFFFVLSGMVLSYPYLQLGKKMDIGKFYINRVFRIYPGFWVALIAGFLYAHKYRLNTDLLVDLFTHNNEQFWEEFLLLKGHNIYYGAGWSLTIEIIFSFLMPFLVAMAKYNRKLIPWLIGISFLTSNITGIFLFHFSLGLFIAAYFQELRSDTLKETRWYRYRYILITLAIILFSMRQWTRIWPIGGSTLFDIIHYFQLDFSHASAPGAFIFIICLIRYQHLRRAFEHRFMIYLGKISYGVYLIHWVLVWAMGDYWESRILPLFPGPVSAVIVCAVVIFLLTLILASVLHYWIEIPFMKLGQKLARKMKPTVEI